MPERSALEPLAIAERALEAVRPGYAAQATVTVERSLLLRFARSRPTQSTAVDDVTVELTAVCDGHLASATTNGTEPAALASCARAAEISAGAVAAQAEEEASRPSRPAEIGGTSGPYPGLPRPSDRLSGAPDSHDPDTARLDPAPGSAALVAAFAAAGERSVEAHGTWTAAESRRAIVSTEGIAAEERLTDAFMKVTCIRPDGRSGYAAGAGVSAGDLGPQELTEKAARKATAPGEVASLPPGEYPVVLEPHAVGELLSWLGFAAFNGLAYAEGRSVLAGRLGTRVAAPAVNLSDAPRHPGTLPRGFDAEGVPKSPIPLIQDGVAHRVVHDTRTAHLVGGPSTGHALAPGGSSWGAVPTNLVLAGGGAADEAELCSPVERGIYVTRLWYVNAVRPREAVLTGVTRDGTFLIEDGRLTRPLADLRFTDSALGLLERVGALTARSLLTSEGRFYGRRFASGVVCPALRAESMRFTG